MIEAENEAVGLRFFDQPAVSAPNLGAIQQRGMKRNTLHDLAEEELPYDAIARRAEILLYDKATLGAIARRGERLRAEGQWL